MDKKTILEVKRYMGLSDDTLHKMALENNDVFYFCAVFGRIEHLFEELTAHRDPIKDQKFLLLIHDYIDPNAWVRLGDINPDFYRYTFHLSNFDFFQHRSLSQIEHVLKLWESWEIPWNKAAMSERMITASANVSGLCSLYARFTPEQKRIWFNGLVQKGTKVVQMINLLNGNERQFIGQTRFLQDYFSYLQSDDFQRQTIDQRIPHYCIGGPLPHDIEQWDTIQRKKLSRTLTNHMQRSCYQLNPLLFEAIADCKGTFEWLKQHKMTEVIEHYGAGIVFRLGSKSYKDENWLNAIQWGFYNALILRKELSPAILSVIDCKNLKLEDVPSLRLYLQKNNPSEEIDLHF